MEEQRQQGQGEAPVSPAVGTLWVNAAALASSAEAWAYSEISEAVARYGVELINTKKLGGMPLPCLGWAVATHALGGRQAERDRIEDCLMVHQSAAALSSFLRLAGAGPVVWDEDLYEALAPQYNHLLGLYTKLVGRQGDA